MAKFARKVQKKLEARLEAHRAMVARLSPEKAKAYRAPGSRNPKK